MLTRSHLLRQAAGVTIPRRLCPFDILPISYALDFWAHTVEPVNLKHLDRIFGLNRSIKYLLTPLNVLPDPRVVTGGCWGIFQEDARLLQLATLQG